MDPTKMEVQNKINEVEEESVDSWKVGTVKASTPFLKAKDFPDNKILQGVIITGLISHNPEKVEVGADNVERNFKENWVVRIDYDKKEFLLRLTSKDIVALRDELKLGEDMNKWVGQRIALVVKNYGKMGKGFGVVV